MAALAAHCAQLKSLHFFVDESLFEEDDTAESAVQLLHSASAELILLGGAPREGESLAPFIWSEGNKQPWWALRPRLRVCDEEPYSPFGYWAR
jgi:hypothetical protein